MTPIIVPPAAHVSTGRSRELEARLRAAIADYTKANPKVTRTEIAAAVHALRVFDEDDSRQRRKVAVLATAAAALIAIMLGGLANAHDRGRSLYIPLVGLAVVGVLLGTVGFLKWRDR